MNVEMTTLDRVDSLAERAYRALREQIAAGGLAPGERVTERGLGLQLGVSATPIREALRRLEQERLVERVAARQLRIAAHSDQTLRELMYTEAVLRAAAARIATSKISDDTIDEMHEIVEELERDPENSDPEYQLSLAMRFDALLHAAAGRPLLGHVLGALDELGARVVVVLSTLWEVAPRRQPEWDRVHRFGDPEYDRWLRSEYLGATAYLSSGGARVVWLTAPCASPAPSIARFWSDETGGLAAIARLMRRG